MAKMDLGARLERGDVIVMDGGVSTAMEEKGLPMDAEVWSGTAHMSHPDLVRAVHEDYIRAGAEVITANTFAAAPHVLRSRDHAPEEATAINRRAVEIAREARDNAAAGDVWIAGSMSSMPPLTRIAETAVGPGVADSYRRQAEALADGGCDLIAAEMMIDRENAALVLDAAGATGLPLWIGLSASVTEAGEVTAYRGDVDYSDMPAGDFAALVESVLARGGQAAGVMHSEIRAIGPALDVVRERWSGPFLAYAETGRFINPDWDFSTAASPDEYADAAEVWVREHGVSIVGGCCGTGPAHVRALKERFA
jgi:S-methylmethionine-dependent homocysteine/selenocysteine methylase